MIAGTLIVRRAAGPLPGYLMRRGTVVLAGGCDRAVADISRLRRARPRRHAADGSIRQGLQRCRCCCPSRTAAAAGGRHGGAGQGRSILCGRMTIGSNRYVSQEAAERPAEAAMGLIELVLTVCALALPDAMRRAASSLRGRHVAQSVRHEGAAVYRAVDQRAPEMGRRALAVRVRRHQGEDLMRAEARAKRDAFLNKLKSRPAVMGILNLTPDSFSDGGRFQAFRCRHRSCQEHGRCGMRHRRYRRRVDATVRDRRSPKRRNSRASSRS